MGARTTVRDPLGPRSYGSIVVMAQLPSTTDTIVAIASAPGAGAVGVVRLSGPDAYAVADRLFRPRRGPTPSQRAAGRVVYGQVVDTRPGHAPASETGEAGEPAVVDEALLLTFRAPHSYTTQDVVEIQTHGGPAVLRSTLDLCVRHGARLAGPGEFTLRAYLNGRLDLVQAESVIDIVNAQSDSARRNAALGLGGALTERLNGMQSLITHAYAAVQASFDYPDEGVPEAQLGQPLAAVQEELRSLLATAEAGRLSRSGARLALLGRPNAGKSSLLNALLGYQRSIVSATPGTTRDYLEAPLVLGGVPITAIDTAGIRESTDAIEASGVEQARLIGLHADLRLALLDGSVPLTDDDLALLADLPEERTLVVVNKRDHPPAFPVSSVPVGRRPAAIEVSALTGQGLTELQQAVTLALIGDAAGSELWITQERHVAALEAVERHVRAARELADSDDLGLVALELQDALSALASLTGRHDVPEETLASIFERFCVGK